MRGNQRDPKPQSPLDQSRYNRPFEHRDMFFPSLTRCAFFSLSRDNLEQSVGSARGTCVMIWRHSCDDPRHKWDQRIPNCRTCRDGTSSCAENRYLTTRRRFNRELSSLGVLRGENTSSGSVSRSLSSSADRFNRIG